MATTNIRSDNFLTKFWANKRVLITGGSKGLGKGLALQLANLGAKVAILARHTEALTEVKIQNSKIITIQADISNKNDIYKITGQVTGALGETIDVLINNASSLGISPLANLIDTPCENFILALETNVLGPFRLIKAILPAMLLNKSGLIVNITSDASISAYSTWGVYSSSKAALDHLTAIWSKELPNITFLAIDPGDMFTDLQLEANSEADESSLLNPNNVARELVHFLALYENNSNKTRFSASEWRDLI